MYALVRLDTDKPGKATTRNISRTNRVWVPFELSRTALPPIHD